MLTAIYHMLKDGTHHQDLGADHFDRRSNEAKARHHVAQLAMPNYNPLLRWPERRSRMPNQAARSYFLELSVARFPRGGTSVVGGAFQPPCWRPDGKPKR